MKSYFDFFRSKEVYGSVKLYEGTKKSVNPFKNPIDPSELTCCVILISLFNGDITTNKSSTNEIFEFLKSSKYISNFDLVDSHSSIKGKIKSIKNGLDEYFKTSNIEKFDDVHSKIWDGVSQAYLIYNELSSTIKNNFSKIYWTASKFPEKYEYLSSYNFDDVKHDNTSDLLLEVRNTDGNDGKYDLFGISLKIGNPTLKNTSLSKLGKTFNEQKSEVIYLDDDESDLHPFIRDIRKSMYEFYNNIFVIYLNDNIKLLTDSYNYTFKNKKLTKSIKRNLDRIMSTLFINFKPDEYLDYELVSKGKLTGEDWLLLVSTTFEENILNNVIKGSKTRLKDEFRKFINEQLKKSKSKNTSFLMKLEKLPEQKGFTSRFINYLLETAYKFNIDKELESVIKKLENSSDLNCFLYFLCSSLKVSKNFDNLGEGKLQNLNSLREELTVLVSLLENDELVLKPYQTSDTTVTMFFYLCEKNEKHPDKNGYLKLEFRYKGRYNDLNLQVYFNKYLKSQLEDELDDKTGEILK